MLRALIGEMLLKTGKGQFADILGGELLAFARYAKLSFQKQLISNLEFR